MEQGGVYSIKNTATGREYIGETMTTFKKRWGYHRTRLRHNKHPNKALQADWIEYGEASFAFIILSTTGSSYHYEKECIRDRRENGIWPYNANIG